MSIEGASPKGDDGIILSICEPCEARGDGYAELMPLVKTSKEFPSRGRLARMASLDLAVPEEGVRDVRFATGDLLPLRVSSSKSAMSMSNRDVEGSSALRAGTVVKARDGRTLLVRHGCWRCCTTRDALVGSCGSRRTAGASKGSNLKEASM